MRALLTQNISYLFHSTMSVSVSGIELHTRNRPDQILIWYFSPNEKNKDAKHHVWTHSKEEMKKMEQTRWMPEIFVKMAFYGHSQLSASKCLQIHFSTEFDMIFFLFWHLKRQKATSNTTQTFFLSSVFLCFCICRFTFNGLTMKKY